MKQQTFSDYEYENRRRRTRRDLFLATMDEIIPWNEWTEMSYLEPDDVYGYGYLEAIRDVFTDYSGEEE